nr:hypothetical protein [Psittacine picornavirus]
MVDLTRSRSLADMAEKSPDFAGRKGNKTPVQFLAHDGSDADKDLEGFRYNAVKNLIALEGAFEFITSTLKPATLTNLIYDMIVAESATRRITIVAAFLEAYPLISCFARHIPDLTCYIDLWLESFVKVQSKDDDIKTEEIVINSQAGTVREADCTPIQNLVMSSVTILGTLLLGGTAKVLGPNASGLMRSTKEAAQTVNSLSGVFKVVKGAFASICTDFLGIVPDDPVAQDIAQKIVNMNGILPRLRESNELLKQDLSLYFARSGFYSSLFENAWRVEESATEVKETTATFRDKYREFVKEFATFKDIVRDTVALTTRPRPAVLWLWGPPGHGKSTMACSVVQELSMLEGRALSTFKYNGSDQYQSGYIGQDVWIFDDFGMTTTAEEVKLFMCLVNDQVHRLNMASLEAKGRIFTSKYIIVTSNLMYFAPPSILNTPEALLRRRDFVVKVVDKELQKGRQSRRTYRDDTHLTMTMQNPQGVQHREGRAYFENIGESDGRNHLAHLLHQKAAEYAQEHAAHVGHTDAHLQRPSVPGVPPIDSDDTDTEPDHADYQGADDDDLSIHSESLDCLATEIFLIIGPPGTGKTMMLSQFRDRAIELNHERCMSLVSGELDGTFFVFDDVTIDQNTFDMFLKVVHFAYSRNMVVVATANGSLWDDCMNKYTKDLTVHARKETRDLYERRIIRIETKFNKKATFQKFTAEDVRAGDADKKVSFVRRVDGGAFVSDFPITYTWLEDNIRVKFAKPNVALLPETVPDVPFNSIFVQGALDEFHAIKSLADALRVLHKVESNLTNAQLLLVGKMFSSVRKDMPNDVSVELLASHLNRKGFSVGQLPAPIAIVFYDYTMFIWSSRALILRCRFEQTDLRYRGYNLHNAGILMKHSPKSNKYKTLALSDDSVAFNDRLATQLMTQTSLGTAPRAVATILQLASYALSIAGTACGIVDIIDVVQKKRALKGAHKKPARNQAWYDDPAVVKAWDSDNQVERQMDSPFAHFPKYKTFLANASSQSKEVTKPEDFTFETVAPEQLTKSKFADLDVKQQCGGENILTCSKKPFEASPINHMFYFLMNAYGLNPPSPPWTLDQFSRYSRDYQRAVSNALATKSRSELYDATCHAYWRFISWKFSVCDVVGLEPVHLRGMPTPFDSPKLSLLNTLIEQAKSYALQPADPDLIHSYENLEVVNQASRHDSSVMQMLATNIFPLEALNLREDGVGVMTYSWALGLFDNYYLVNLHMLRPGCHAYVKVGITRVLADVVYRSEPEHDFAIVQLKGTSSVRNIMNHWCTDAELDRIGCQEGVLLSCSRVTPGVVHTQAIRFGQSGPILHGNCAGRVARVISPNFTYVKTFLTKEGDCGSPYLAFFSGQPKIVGIHTAGSANCGFMVCVSADMIKTCLSFTQTPKDGLLQVRSEGKQDVPIGVQADVDHRATEDYVRMSINRLSYQSVRFYTKPDAQGSIGVVTDMNGDNWEPHLPAKTQLHVTPFIQDGCGEPAIMSELDPRNKKGVDPFKYSRDKWLSKSKALRPEIQDQFVVAFDYIFDELLAKMLIHRPVIRRLTNLEAINWPTDVPDVNSLNKSSSAGLPWKMVPGVSGKQPMLIFDATKQIWMPNVTSEVGVSLMKAVSQLTTACLALEKTAVVFDATLKDEVLPLNKIEDVRTRIILGAPLELTILHRKYFSTLGAFICSLHNEIPVKVGINQYQEWDTLY